MRYLNSEQYIFVLLDRGFVGYIFLQPVANTYPENAHTEVITFRFFVVQFKGDWKYLVQLFNLTNQPTKEKAGLQSP